jgi:hypothetical protein
MTNDQVFCCQDVTNIKELCLVVYFYIILCSIRSKKIAYHTLAFRNYQILKNSFGKNPKKKQILINCFHINIKKKRVQCRSPRSA